MTDAIAGAPQPKAGDDVTVTARHWYNDPIVRICLLQFVVMMGAGYNDAYHSDGKITFAIFVGIVISAITAVIRAQAPQVVTGLKIFDDTHNEASR